jgi:hypothetical protein
MEVTGLFPTVFDTESQACDSFCLRAYESVSGIVVCVGEFSEVTFGTESDEHIGSDILCGML